MWKPLLPLAFIFLINPSCCDNFFILYTAELRVIVIRRITSCDVWYTGWSWKRTAASGFLRLINWWCLAVTIFPDRCWYCPLLAMEKPTLLQVSTVQYKGAAKLVLCAGSVIWCWCLVNGHFWGIVNLRYSKCATFIYTHLTLTPHSFPPMWHY